MWLREWFNGSVCVCACVFLEVKIDILSHIRTVMKSIHEKKKESGGSSRVTEKKPIIFEI